MRALLLAAAVTLAAATPAFAAGATPKASGLVGTKWATEDCKASVSASNVFLEYSISDDGRLVENLTSARGTQSRKLRNVQLMSPDWMLYTMDDDDGEAVNIVTFTDSQGRKKTWWSVGNAGKAYVVDGKFPDQSNGPPWFKPCK